LEQVQQHVASETRNTYAVISGLVSAISVISLVAKVFDVGLAPVLREFIEFYRRIANILISPLLYIVPFQVPEWYRDAFVASLVAMMLFCRSSYLAWPNRSAADSQILNWMLYLLLSFLFSIPLIGLLLLAIFPLKSLSSDKFDRGRARARLFVIALVTTSIAAGAFFALNSQL
jgi:hypothetical protein